MSALKRTAIQVTTENSLLSPSEGIRNMKDFGLLKPAALVLKANPPHRYAMCSVIHPSTSSCFKYSFEVWFLEFIRSLQLYIPLNTVFLIMRECYQNLL
jgi:hypothetical protein